MNGKKVGNNYERSVSTSLSKWFTGSDDKLVCWRNTGSGSVGTFRKQKGKSGENVTGDFQCLDSAYEEFFKTFNCDSKSYGKWNPLLNNPKNIKSNDIHQQWIKVYNESKESNRIPIIILQIRDRKTPEMIIFPIYTRHNNTNYIKYCFEDSTYNCQILYLSEFFEKNNWQDFVDKNKK